MSSASILCYWFITPKMQKSLCESGIFLIMHTGRSSVNSVLSAALESPGYRVNSHIIELPYIRPLICIESANDRSVNANSGLMIYERINIPRFYVCSLFAFNFDKVHPLAILSWFINFTLTYTRLRLFNGTMVKCRILPELIWRIFNWKVLLYFSGPIFRSDKNLCNLLY